MRTAFINQLIAEAEQNDRIFLLVGDLGFSVVEPFAERFPNQYLNVGIAEQNMAGMAAGLAMEGYCVYIYSIGNFPTLRCMEQIRYDICYHNLNVKIVAVGGGYSYAALGASHHATEEYGMLRTIPNLTICAPGDPEETRQLTAFSARYNGPVYLRLGKAGEPLVYEKGSVPDMERGQVLNPVKGERVAVLSTGSVLKYAVDFVQSNQLNASVYSFPFIKPIADNQLIDILQKYDKLITIEEHQLMGGFGSAILEYLNDTYEQGYILKKPRVKRIGINDEFYSIAGTQAYLRELSGIQLQLTDFI